MDATALRQLPILSPALTRPSVGTPDGVKTLIDEFLAQQATTSAVERFSSAHDLLDSSATPVQSRWYRDLMPTAAPGPGQQYAFEVDLDSCSGCKACVVACHSQNGLDEGESWRSVGLLVGTGDTALTQPVTTGCHHCTDPGCLSGCPVDAYVKLDNGIVKHLDDQCIGCSYCTLTCPYEVPQYDAARGIVRKCDMCHDRLAVGEAPPCVQSCPTEAIRITVVDVEDAATDGWGFDAPSPAATGPTTVYRSTRDLTTNVSPADRHTVRPRHAHPPLVVMLVLTQLAIGAFVVGELLRLAGTLATTSAAPVAAGTLGVTALALGASLAHLGRPQYAWRAVIGLRHSWLSREIVGFGVFAGLGSLHAIRLGGWGPAVLDVLPSSLTGAAASAVGLLAVVTSVMVYVATRREGWTLGHVGLRFGLTTVGLGTTAALLLVVVTGSAEGSLLAALGWVSLGSVMVALAIDLVPLRQVSDPTMTAGRTSQLLRGPLIAIVRARVGLGLVGALAIVAVLAAGPDTPRGATIGLLGVALLASLLAEGCARWWFFTAEGSPRMPGVPA